MNQLRIALSLFFILFGITKIIPLFGFGYGFDGTVWFVGEAMGYSTLASFMVVMAIIFEIALGVGLLMPQMNSNCAWRQRVSAYGLAVFTGIATLLFHVPLIAGETLTPELTNSLKNLIIISALVTVGNNIESKH